MIHNKKGFFLSVMLLYATCVYGASEAGNVYQDDALAPNEPDVELVIRDGGDSVSSKVLNRAQGVQTSILLKNSGNITVELDGKLRIDAIQYGCNTKLLNSANNMDGNLDTFVVPGKHTFDLGFGARYGEEKYGRDVVTFGCNLRNKMVWGKPANIVTTPSTIKDNEYVFGRHNHQLGLPAIFLRGADLTFELNPLFKESIFDWNHYYKIGVFPFSVASGISLGAAYLIQPDFITYDVENTIQEFAPGYMFYGNSLDNTFAYKFYMGVTANKSGSFADVNEHIRGQEYGKKYNPSRGFGVLNLVSAATFDFKIVEEDNECGGKDKWMLSPYIVGSRNAEETVDFLGDAHSRLATFGLLSDTTVGNHTFSFEIAQNYGSQNVAGVDRNIVTKKIRDQIPGLPLLVNSHVNYVAFNEGQYFDVPNQNATYLIGNPRQKAINNVYPEVSNNGKAINSIVKDGVVIDSTIDLVNAPDRFRDPYTNYLRGFMGIADYTYEFSWRSLCTCPITSKASLAVGLASGDENPNKSLLGTDDSAENGTYSGFIGLQEIYTGKTVQSVFLLSGVGQIPRIASIPGRGDAGSYGYPSAVSRFTNLAYVGGSFENLFESENFKWKIKPNILEYWQPAVPRVYDPVLAERLGFQVGQAISSHLGSELNIFLEAQPLHVEGIQFFATATCFLPGAYYKDISGIPLDKRQEAYLDRVNANGVVDEFVPTTGSNAAFYIMAGLEYRF